MIARKAGYEVTLSSGIFGIQRGLKGPGRYLVYERPEGGLDWRWVSEEYVLGTFVAEGASLPEPPETVAVSRARVEIFFWRVVYIVGIGAPLIGFLWWRRQRWK